MGRMPPGYRARHGRSGGDMQRISSPTSDVDLRHVGPVYFEAMTKPAQLYQVPERASANDQTPRTYTNTQFGSGSFPARPPPVHETSSDARSWSRQTEDALDAYKRRNEKHKTNIDQFIRVEAAEYRLDSGINEALGDSLRAARSNQPSEKAASKYHAITIDVAQVVPETEREPGYHNGQPQNHRMTKMIVKEDIDFFTALLEGHDPPPTATETQTFVHDETEIRRQSQETSEREADLRRQEEAQAAKADTDFFMMLMQKQ